VLQTDVKTVMAANMVIILFPLLGHVSFLEAETADDSCKTHQVGIKTFFFFLARLKKFCFCMWWFPSIFSKVPFQNAH